MQPAPQLQFDLRGTDIKVGEVSGASIDHQGQRIPILYAHNGRAKRYRLFVDRQGRPRVTIPRRGSQVEARRFLARHHDWLLQQLQRFALRQAQSNQWRADGEVLFRGLTCRLSLQAGELPGWNQITFGDQTLMVSEKGLADDPAALRRVIERHLWQLAASELPGRVQELAALHQSLVARVTVRNQRTRWGSCSRSGTISLNWRLIQVPVAVRDYIILHELMHLREMNHSRRFWALVEKACPDYESSERWLRENAGVLA